ncbi:MAG: type I restriction endonuclease subunit R [Methanobrevibacter sp.]|nr:type I restriction endonuclease subunit R [Methanobrevibacter sp.]
MTIESESMLEEKFIKQLQSMGYERIKIDNEEELNANFKTQLEKLNKKELNGKALTDDEFERILIYLDAGSIFDKAEKLRDEYTIKRDDDTSVSIKFLNQRDWCKNIFQVTNQITMRKEHENRYDVTILINGLPLVQAELKRSSLPISKAFNQIKRYMYYSYKNLFEYIQIFIVSNGKETKYFSNCRPSEVNFGFTFYWKDEDNKNIHSLEEFSIDFLEPCNIAKMISKFMVLNKSSKQLMVLRAYQKNAVDAVLKQALENKLNGYVYHTTGSGKTLTSYKVSQLLTEEPSIYKVVFVVDRSDLDDQTNKEFNKFSDNDIGSSDYTGELVKNLLSDKNKLITTTIQKLNLAVTRKHNKKRLEKIKDENIIFIFDECHRSQFGKMQQNISNFFENSLSYGFTGTPIFKDNSMGDKTTKMVFGKQLHTYMIKDAIADHNVLGFSIDYYNTVKAKDDIADEKVKSIKINEAYAHPDRLNMVVDKIIDSYNAKTKDKEFNAIFAVSQKTEDNPNGFIHDYYKLFKKKIKERNLDLKVATIFTYDPNEKFEEKHSQKLLDEYMADYNEMFGTNFDTSTMREYHRDVNNRMKTREIDLLIVINMFLTGFDSKKLNTLYIDKNLKYHGLLQAFSRTNRIFNDLKSHGNIVCFDRPVRDDVDKALALFSNNAPIDTILLPTYEELVKTFNDDLKKLYKLVKTVQEVYELQSEKQKAKFIESFNKLIKTKNKLDTFVEFTFDDLDIDQQDYDDFTGAYLNIVDTLPPKEDGGGGPISILDDVEFEIELLRNDKINVDYILELLENINIDDNYPEDKKRIIKMMQNNVNLRSKIKLMEKFMDSELNRIRDNNLNIKEEFDNFVHNEKRQAICDLIDEEQLSEEITREILSEYEFSDKIDDDLIEESFKDKNLLFIDKMDKIDRVKEEILEIFELFDFEEVNDYGY